MRIVVISYLLILLLTNCTPSKFEKQIITYVFDFTKYTDKRFLFTPEQYNGDYLSIGILEIEIYPQTEEVPSKSKSN